MATWAVADTIAPEGVDPRAGVFGAAVVVHGHEQFLMRLGKLRETAPLRDTD